MDEIGVSLPPQQPHISPPDTETSVRFNIRRAIPWDLWDLCEAEPINCGICGRCGDGNRMRLTSTANLTQK